MQKIILLIATLCVTTVLKSQINSIDSMKAKRDTIIKYKAKYIGKRMSVLFNDLKCDFWFHIPKAAGNRRGGLSYYYKDYIVLPNQKGYPIYHIVFTLNNKFELSLNDIHNMDYIQRTKIVKNLLKKQIIADISAEW